MKRTIDELMDELDVRPGMPDWEFAVRGYAMDMLKEYMKWKNLDQWDEASLLGEITEETLLNGAKDWEQYSRNGNSLIYERDIRRRLGGNRSGDLLSFQAGALKEAAQLIIAEAGKPEPEDTGYDEFDSPEELNKHLKYWSNSCGELHYHGRYDLTSDSQMPKELQRAYKELWTEGNGCLEYLAEYDGKYYIALITEFDKDFACYAGISKDGLYELVKMDAIGLSGLSLFKDTVLILGKETGCDECHEVLFLVPAMEKKSTHDAIECVICDCFSNGVIGLTATPKRPPGYIWEGV